MKNIFNKNKEEEIVEVPIVETTEIVESTEPKLKEVSDADVINLSNITQIYTSTPKKKFWQVFKKVEPQTNTIFSNFNLNIKDFHNEGQFITIMGKSGCGKSTLLRYISGLQTPTSGDVYIYGNKRTDKDRIPMVFQQYTSFEWMTVLENIALPLIIHGETKEIGRASCRERV